ncbi:unnamed protein product, partial [Brassica rapa subsp. narinosa]
MCKCRSHGTFPLFGLQSSHLNICYYHQDLHRRPLRPGSRPRFCSDRRALLLIEAWLLPRRPGIGRRACFQRHPFSGLVDSAADRFTRRMYRCGHHQLPDFAPLSIVHHLRVPTACSHSNPSQKIKVGRLCTREGSSQSASLRYGFTHPLTRTHVRLLGPCFKTGRMGSPQADALS